MPGNEKPRCFERGICFLAHLGGVSNPLVCQVTTSFSLNTWTVALYFTTCHDLLTVMKNLQNSLQYLPIMKACSVSVSVDGGGGGCAVVAVCSCPQPDWGLVRHHLAIRDLSILSVQFHHLVNFHLPSACACYCCLLLAVVIFLLPSRSQCQSRL